MSELEFNTYVAVGLLLLAVNVGYSLVRLIQCFRASEGRRALIFGGFLMFWVLASCAVIAFVFVLGMAHRNINYYTSLARITLIAYPIAGSLYFVLQKAVYHRRA